MIRSRLFLPVLLLVLGTTFVGCDSGGDNEENDNRVQMELDVNDLPPLFSGLNYRAWAVLPDKAVPSDPFNFTPEGQYVNSIGQFISNTLIFTENISSAETILISIEGKDGREDRPSDTVIFAGDVQNHQASLTTSHSLALGTDFASSTGVFSLMTPSDSDPNNETAGVWFADPGQGGSLSAGLSLPTLPAGWAYEGWVEIADTVLSTGAFVDVDDIDMDAVYSDAPEFVSFPGEDFLVNSPPGVTFPPDLSGARVYLSVEPLPDDSANQFAIEVLSGSVPSTPSANTAYSMQTAVQAPVGTASIK